MAGAVVACAAAEFDGVGARVLRAELVRVTDALKLLERLCVGEDPSESDCVPEADAEADWEGDSDAEGVAEGSAVGETPLESVIVIEGVRVPVRDAAVGV